VWRVAGNGRHRLTLVDLPSNHGQPGPVNPALAATEQDHLRLLHLAYASSHAETA
jgi:hypothetical protein